MLHTLPTDIHSALQSLLSTSPYAREFFSISAQTADLNFELNIIRLLKRQFLNVPRILLKQLTATITDRRRRILYEISY